MKGLKKILKSKKLLAVLQNKLAEEHHKVVLLKKVEVLVVQVKK
jgi:hypothetical protein